MHIEPGVRLGPYEIVAPIGAGGMGEVYRARDTRLERNVAIKILPAEFAGDARLKLRFEREAKAISSLSHPNICTLFDVGHDNGTDFLVMELIEGETLAARLTRGPLSLADALRTGIEIAGALEKAHRHGIVHRDLKPGNVMLTKAGAKLLDFGLAKAVTSGLGPHGSAAATQQKPVTEEGMIVGTFQYMAPEQIEGEDADARTDIFAFGAVLYEMVTGRKAFSGKSKTSLIASILSAEPAPMSALQPTTPPTLERVITTCLAKDPGERWQTAHDLQLELKWIAEARTQAARAEPGRRGRWAWVLAAAALILAGIGWAIAAREMRRPHRVVRSYVLPPEKTSFAFDRGAMALSPDGSRIAFVARSADDTGLFVQPLDALTAQPLNGTVRASSPFWSPDGRSIGFFADGKLKRVDIAGGPPQTIANTGVGRGATWGRGGLILFAPDPRVGIYGVPAGGGTVRPVTQLEKGESTHRWPYFLPDGRHFVYVTQAAAGGISLSGDSLYVASIDNPRERKFLLHTSANVAYAEPGYLLFHRDRSLLAQRFDLDALTLSGDPFRIAEDVQFIASSGAAIFAVAGGGTLVYQSGGSEVLSNMTWFDALGNSIGSTGAPADYQRPRVSPDGRRIAVDVIDAQSGNVDLWIHDTARKTASRFTFDPAVDLNACWSPDSRRIVFNSTRLGPSELYEKVTTGSGNETLLYDCQRFCVPTSWSSDGRFIGIQMNDPKTKWDVWTWSVDEKKAIPLIVGEFNESSPSFSPDGRWLAYSSDETGRTEIYVQTVPPGSGRWQVSSGGGSHPVWSRDGEDIFFMSLDDELMRASVHTSPQFEAGEARKVFAAKLKALPGRRYDVSSDKKQFLMNTPLSEERSPPFVLVLNWAANHPAR